MRAPAMAFALIRHRGVPLGQLDHPGSIKGIRAETRGKGALMLRCRVRLRPRINAAG
jgi:hypothetical protein